jgi:hypothetical protein
MNSMTSLHTRPLTYSDEQYREQQLFKARYAGLFDQAPLGWQYALPDTPHSIEEARRLIEYATEQSYTDDADVYNVTIGLKQIAHAHGADNSDELEELIGQRSVIQELYWQAMFLCGMQAIPNARIVYRPEHWAKAYVYMELCGEWVPRKTAIRSHVGKNGTLASSILLGYSLESYALETFFMDYAMESVAAYGSDADWKYRRQLHLDSLTEGEMFELYNSKAARAITEIKKFSSVWYSIERRIKSIVRDVAADNTLKLYMRGF